MKINFLYWADIAILKDRLYRSYGKHIHKLLLYNMSDSFVCVFQPT